MFKVPRHDAAAAGPVVACGSQMIISKTPFRVSFFGGGTDYPAYYREHGGAVLGAAIDKHCYLTCRYLPPFFDHTSRIVYSEQERVNSNGEIRHPSIRAALEEMGIDEGVEIHHDGDLPARSGLGSSSSCTVGMLNALYALKGLRAGKLELAQRAIEIEQNVLEENVGSQDQTFAAHGGFNKILFRENGDIEVIPITVSAARRESLQRCLMLCFTRTMRVASVIAATVIENIPRKLPELRELRRMVDLGEDIVYEGSLDDLGRLLHEGWLVKRSISDAVSNPFLDDLYARATRAGALGGKITGAGGGGFMLFYVPESHQEAVRAALQEVVWVPVSLGAEGSKIIYYAE